MMRLSHRLVLSLIVVVPLMSATAVRASNRPPLAAGRTDVASSSAPQSRQPADTTQNPPQQDNTDSSPTSDPETSADLVPSTPVVTSVSEPSTDIVEPTTDTMPAADTTAPLPGSTTTDPNSSSSSASSTTTTTVLPSDLSPASSDEPTWSAEPPSTPAGTGTADDSGALAGTASLQPSPSSDPTDTPDSSTLTPAADTVADPAPQLTTTNAGSGSSSATASSGSGSGSASSDVRYSIVAGRTPASSCRTPNTTDPSAAIATGVSILGPGVIDENEMAKWWHRTHGGQPAKLHTPIDAFIHIVYSEADAEHVRPDLVFAQMVVETGAFTNSDTTIHNFAGIQHYDNVASGRAFADDTAGVRAQVQLLHRVVSGNELVTINSDQSVYWGSTRHTDVWNELGGATTGGVNWASNPNYWTIIDGVYRTMLVAAAAQPPADQVAGGPSSTATGSAQCDQTGSFAYLTALGRDATGTAIAPTDGSDPTDTNEAYVLNSITDQPAAILAARSRPAKPSVKSSGADRAIVFPVLGPVSYADTWGDCRDNCTRRHEGTDLIGVQMQPVLAATDGTITKITTTPTGISGVNISITDDQGWRYDYFHLNNDTPGTDDNSQPTNLGIAAGLQQGDHVAAGQIIGYMGNSGNAEQSVTHLHFEIRDPDGVAHPSYQILETARLVQRCSIGIGPTSTPNVDSYTTAHRDSNADVRHVVVRTATGRGEWVIDTDGRVTANGDAALIAPASDCEAGPTQPFGTDAAGWTRGTSTAALQHTSLADANVSETVLGEILDQPVDDRSSTQTWKDPLTGATIVVTTSAEYLAARSALEHSRELADGLTARPATVN